MVLDKNDDTRKLDNSNHYQQLTILS